MLMHTTCLVFSARFSGPVAGLAVVQVEPQRLATDSAISWTEDEVLCFT